MIISLSYKIPLLKRGTSSSKRGATLLELRVVAPAVMTYQKQWDTKRHASQD